MLRSSSNSDFGLVIGFFGGLWAFFKGFRVYREYKLVADIPRVPIRSVPMGLVRIHGRAQADQLVKSPISKTPCCFYKVDIEQWKTEHDSSGWSHLRTDADGPKFYLQDETGKALIDAHSAEYDLLETCKREVNSDPNRSHSPAMGFSSGATDAELLEYVSLSGVNKIAHFVEGFLEKKGPLNDPKKEEARQAILQLMHAMPHPGETKISSEALLGAAEKMSAAIPLADPEKESARQTALAHFREMANHGLPLPIPMQKIAGATGRYRFTEYCILPGQEYQVTGTCVENPDAHDDHDRNLIMKGHNEPTFLISAKAEGAVPTGLRKKAMWMILGGAAVALFCLAFILNELKLF
jgi:hypothetical protein